MGRNDQSPFSDHFVEIKLIWSGSCTFYTNMLTVCKAHKCHKVRHKRVAKLARRQRLLQIVFSLEGVQLVCDVMPRQTCVSIGFCAAADVKNTLVPGQQTVSQVHQVQESVCKFLGFIDGIN